MNLFTCPSFKSVFNLTCIIATIVMVGYWFNEFLKDEDVCSIDLMSMDRVNKHPVPVMSACFRNPFLNSKLKQIDASLNSSTYLKFISGEIYNDKWRAIGYDNVSINLADYAPNSSMPLTSVTRYYWIRWRNGSYSTHKLSDTTGLRNTYVTFNGFVGLNRFIKCFAIDINTKNIKDITAIWLQHKKEIFPSSIRQTELGFFVFFHLPQQLIISKSTIKHTWPEWKNNPYTKLSFRVKGWDILKRRNKRKEDCFVDYKQYDNFLIEKHMKRVGCTPPYYTSQNNLTICETKKKMKQAKLTLEKQTKDNYRPCVFMTDIHYAYYDRHYDPSVKFDGKMFGIYLTVPDQYKLIHQVEAINFQTLIGNGGGYIGLFLGNVFISVFLKHNELFNVYKISYNI